MLGVSATVKITSVGRWSVFGELIEEPIQVKESTPEEHRVEEPSPSFDSCGGLCSKDVEACQCADNCGERVCDTELEAASASIAVDAAVVVKDPSGGKFASTIPSMLLRRGSLRGSERETVGSHTTKLSGNRQRRVITGKFATLDWILLSGMFASFLTAIALLALLSSETLSSS